jgi:hypothetical protein
MADSGVGQGPCERRLAVIGCGLLASPLDRKREASLEVVGRQLAL